RCICRVGSNGAVDTTDGQLLEELAIHTVSEGIREETAASTPKELARDGTNSRGESSCLPAGNCYPRCQRRDKPFCLKRTGHAGVVRELLSRDADFRARGRDGYSAIHYAATGGHIDVLRILHEKKCNMKAKKDSGQTILHVAADNGNLEAFEWIAENTNIDHNTTNNEGKTALDVAQNGRQKSIVTYLLKDLEANVKPYGMIILHYN
ncbi:receptor-interacting serine/threonine-protein kinase 4, partial [Penaeus vannamei]